MRIQCFGYDYNFQMLKFVSLCCSVHSEGNHFFQVLNPKLETTDIVDHLIEEKIEIEQFHIQKATDIAANDTVLLNIDVSNFRISLILIKCSIIQNSIILLNAERGNVHSGNRRYLSNRRD